MTRKFGILTGGGDCPGLNAVIRAVVKRSVTLGHEVLGIEGAMRGIIEGDGVHPLTLDSVSGILPRGGTILHTSNRSNPFRYPVRQTNGSVIERDLSDVVVQRFRELEIEGVFFVGGDGSLEIGRRFMEKGVKVIGIPKTIDNDVCCTDQSFGFDTARAIATEAVDNLHSTAESHDRVMVVEVMGRNSGFIALDSGTAGGADIIVIPEIPYRVESVLGAIAGRKSRGKRFSIAVVSEGACPIGCDPAIQETAESRPGSGVVRLGGAGRVLAERLAAAEELDVRVTVLGHLQRGGSPTAFDRLLASQYAVHAVDLADASRWGRIASLHGGVVGDVPLNAATCAPRRANVEGQRVMLARRLGICLGD